MTSLDDLLADPPQVHGWQGVPGGVWATDRECYEFIWQHVEQGSRTLETGCGISTAVFLELGTDHTAVFLDSREGTAFREWAARRSLDLSGIRLMQGGSDAVLPTLAFEGPLDLVFIDGGHGFPLPIIDWYYGARHLKAGGLLVLDDVALPGVQRLTEFLHHDPRWAFVHGTTKWRAYRKLTDESLSEEWTSQPWLPTFLPEDVLRAQQLRRALARARRSAGRIRRLV